MYIFTALCVRLTATVIVKFTGIATTNKITDKVKFSINFLRKIAPPISEFTPFYII
jgi:hypothetical protein